MTSKTLPIVGAFYRPPAKAILDFLGVGAKLYVVAEADNAYDENAIAVWATQDGLLSINSNVEIEATLAGYGTSLADLTVCEEGLHVGYIPREMAAELKAQGFPDGVQVDAEFTVSANGAPRVRFNF